jgi:DNA-directed RNA polymerase specialized sigma24 family protein
MSARPGNDPRWVGRLVAQCAELRRCTADPTASPAWGELWLLLNSALLRFLRVHAGRIAPIAADDIWDLAGEKSLDLMDRIVSGAWDPTGRSAGEVLAYLSATARNEVISWWRRERHVISLEDGGEDAAVQRAGRGSAAPESGGHVMRLPIDPPDQSVERGEFVSALLDCAARLDARSRRVWFLRTVLGMRSRDVSLHPGVGSMKPAHVDVVLNRSRRALRACLHAKGYDAESMPSGSFVELWTRFRLEEDR